jgi:hypothetical protein
MARRHQRRRAITEIAKDWGKNRSWNKEHAMSSDARRTDKPPRTSTNDTARHRLDRRSILLGGTTLAAASALASGHPMQVAQAQQQPAPTPSRRPNILVIFGDDIGQTNVSAYSFGVMGYKTPNIDRIDIMETFGRSQGG